MWMKIEPSPLQAAGVVLAIAVQMLWVALVLVSPAVAGEVYT